MFFQSLKIYDRTLHLWNSLTELDFTGLWRGRLLVARKILLCVAFTSITSAYHPQNFKVIVFLYTALKNSTLHSFITRKFYSIICLTFFCCCPLQKFKKKLMQILALMILVVFLAYYYTLRSSHFANKVKLRSLHLLRIQWQNFWTNNSK